MSPSRRIKTQAFDLLAISVLSSRKPDKFFAFFTNPRFIFPLEMYSPKNLTRIFDTEYKSQNSAKDKPDS